VADEHSVQKPLVEPINGTMVPCKVCREPIIRGARKCTHCDSLLDWRGWLGISETTLALLVALVTVVAATAPRIVELFTPRYSDLRVSMRQISYQNIEVVASNQGHKNSQFLSASISAKTQDGNSIEPIDLQINGFPNVAPEQVLLFGLSIPLAFVPNFLNWPHSKIQTAELSVVINEYHKQPETRKIEISIGSFRQFCRATEDADALLRHAPGQAAENRLVSRCLPSVP
jgi:hypothetical protein